jgi:ABC-type amino acid transport substrate-binding protein
VKKDLAVDAAAVVVGVATLGAVLLDQLDVAMAGITVLVGFDVWVGRELMARTRDLESRFAEVAHRRTKRKIAADRKEAAAQAALAQAAFLRGVSKGTDRP